MPADGGGNIRSRGFTWLQNRGKLPLHIRVSRFYPPEASFPHVPAWWCEFPTAEVEEDAWEHISLLCQTAPKGEQFHHLRVPMGLFPACKHHLCVREREGQRLYSLWLSAEPDSLFRELRGSGAIEFRPFLVEE